MNKTRDTSTRRNTSVKRLVRQAGVSNIDYLQSNKINKKSHIKDSNINMNKKAKPMDKAKVLIPDWIANSRQYDPYVRSMLMHPDIIKAYVQLSLNIPVTSFSSALPAGSEATSAPGKPVYPAAPEIIEEQSALLGFAKAHTIYSNGIEDELSFLDRVKPTVIKFLSNLTTSVKVRLYLHCEMENIDIKEAEFRSGSEIILKGGVTNLNELYGNANILY